MKKWTNPEMEVLELDLTEFGGDKVIYIDATYKDEKTKWFSFSGDSDTDN